MQNSQNIFATFLLLFLYVGRRLICPFKVNAVMVRTVCSLAAEISASLRLSRVEKRNYSSLL